MLTLRYFPKSWKTAVVVPILKPGKNSALAESYRPISLLPVLSKLAEKIILARLNDYLEREKILIPEQHGFRPRLSTSHQLLRVVEFIKEGNNNDECTAAVFLDIQKAFDRVWHTGLLFKLITYKIPPPLIFLINSYISDRSFSVKIKTYQLKKIRAGVAQGSILAPTLFNLYVNDIIKNTNTQLCLYADDTAILSRHRNLNTLAENINEHLAHLEIWFSVWKIALKNGFSFPKGNPLFAKPKNPMVSAHQSILVSLLIKPSLSDHTSHILEINLKIQRVNYTPNLQKSKLSRHNKLLIYTLILKPLLTYASPVWGHAAKTNINLLETSQNVIIRQICNAHWYMRNKFKNSL
ncbi:RNA-directed DNA polymerase from mobile element jockey [Trichonephila clavipes]|nr:RNA-directed DNA polymerase from mobile element jockey [Trichonephila clavipes]